MNEEAIKLLENIVEHIQTCTNGVFLTTSPEQIRKWSQEALSLLKEKPKCPMCKDTKKTTTIRTGQDNYPRTTRRTKPCPACQDDTAEFAKALRDWIEYRADTPEEKAIFFKAANLIEQQAEQIVRKDELLYAYESVRAPVNPLIKQNRELKEQITELQAKLEAEDGD